jgi:pSer/pThr/pTyr-binding forkhead associated (FHA) protein
MKSYIRHRLDVAGADGRTIFEPQVFADIFRYTGGVPRLINTLCDTGMMAAFSADATTVGTEELQTAIAELQWVEFAARTHTLSSYQSGPQTEQLTASGQIYARILLRSNGQTLSETPLRVGRRVVGRTTDNDVQIDSRFVSRHHCQLLTTERSTVIEDLNSTNGIHLRGRRIRRQTLRNGDVITIGQHELLYADERLAGNKAFVDTIPNTQASDNDSDSD